MFGFLNKSRKFPDGRDLNRVFQEAKVALCQRFAYHMLTEIMPLVDYAVDFHAGGASRFNAPQIRLAQTIQNLADVFNARLLYILKMLQVHLEIQVIN
jgi:predicted deacylase